MSGHRLTLDGGITSIFRVPWLLFPGPRLDRRLGPRRPGAPPGRARSRAVVEAPGAGMSLTPGAPQETVPASDLGRYWVGALPGFAPCAARDWVADSNFFAVTSIILATFLPSRTS
jgi:hypothetical protein